LKVALSKVALSKLVLTKFVLCRKKIKQIKKNNFTSSYFVGSGMGKIRIRDKHPESATLLLAMKIPGLDPEWMNPFPKNCLK